MLAILRSSKTYILLQPTGVLKKFCSGNIACLAVQEWSAGCSNVSTCFPVAYCTPCCRLDALPQLKADLLSITSLADMSNKHQYQ